MRPERSVWMSILAKRGFLLFLLLNLVLAPKFLLFSDEDGLLKIEASIEPKRLSRGQEGKIILKLTPKKGIRISPQPAFTVAFNPSEELTFPKNFFLASDLNMEILQEDGKEYLSLETPIEIPFTVNLKAVRGRHLLEGKVKYFARSQKEGWCLKNSAKFSVSFYSSSQVIKK